MRKLIMKMSMSLDGFVGIANGGNDWVFKTGDEESLAWSVAAISEAGLIIMGRNTFEMIGPYWQTATGPFAAPMNEIPKALFTKNGFKGSNPENTISAARNARSYNAARGIPHNEEASAAGISWGDARVFDGDLTGGSMNSNPGRANRSLRLVARDLCRFSLQRVSLMNITWPSIPSHWVRGYQFSAVLQSRLI